MFFGNDVSDMHTSENYWDRMAGSYDHEEEHNAPIRNEIIARTRDYLKIRDIVLELGCGTGAFCNELAHDVKRVHAIDISVKMIERAKNKANERNIKNIEFSHTTIHDMKFKKDSLDVIATYYVLHLLENVKKDILRIHELLKPGGLLISVTPCIGEENRVMKFLYSVGSTIRVLPKIGNHWSNLFTIVDLKDTITQANFDIIDTEQVSNHFVDYLLIAKKI